MLFYKRQFYSLAVFGCFYRITIVVIDKIASYLPENILSNEALAEVFLDWPADKIYSKTGILTRHVAEKEEYASDLAIKAAKKLLESENPDSIDFFIYCTQSPDYLIPTTACTLQDKLGLPRTCGAFDINLGCSGYAYSLATGYGLINSGIADKILLVTSDVVTHFLKPDDRVTRTLFGDAATATLLSKDSRNKLSSFAFGTDGSGANQLKFPGSGVKDNDFNNNYLTMDGPGIFNFTIREVPKIVNKILDKSGLHLEGIDLFIFHQANQFILEHIRKKMKIEKEKFVYYIENVGNTQSGTIPLALENLKATNRLKPGMKIMLVGFGVGLSLSGCLLEWESE